MKLKRIKNVLIFGLCAGFIFGLAKAMGVISSHQYFHYGLYRLILLELTASINKGIFYGLSLAIFFVLFIMIISFFWRKLFSPFFEIRVIKRNKLTPLFKGVFAGVLFAYLILQTLKFLQSPYPNPNFLLWQSLIVFLLFLLLLSFEKIYSRLENPEMLDLLKKAGIKIAAGTILSIFLLMNILACGQKIFSRPSGPNILLIVADALRADHLGCYGYNRPTSPQIDKFASEALIFEKAMSNSPWTKPSIGALLTSLYPHEHRASYWKDNLSDGCLTLAEVFRNRNYNSLAIQTNPSITQKHNFKQGFQHYQEMVQEKADAVTSNFVAWIKKHKKNRFLAYLHYMDTHVPYNAPQEFSQIFGLKNGLTLNRGEFKTFDIRILTEMGLSQEKRDQLVDLYDGAIKYFDYNFEKIVDNLEKLGILNKTIIILTSDHGEEFWEHSGFAHGHQLYQEVLHVPLIIKYSSKLPVKRIQDYVQLLDLFPTVLSMAGIKSNFDFRGKDLISSIYNNKKVNEEIFIEGILFGPEKKGILKDGWKLIENTEEKNEDTFDLLGDVTKYIYPEYKKGFELYNINQDFLEKYNLVNDYPQIAAELNKHLLKLRTNTLVFPSQKKTRLKEKLKDLKSLGYIK